MSMVAGWIYVLTLDQRPEDASEGEGLVPGEESGPMRKSRIQEILTPTTLLYLWAGYFLGGCWTPFAHLSA
jgi:hypothetical protein